MFYLNLIREQFTAKTRSYPSLKNEEDLGADKVAELIEKFPINQKIFTWKNEEIKKHVAALIKDVQNVPVTDSNIDTIKEHLRGVATTCCRVKERIIRELEKAKKIDLDLRRNIMSGIILTSPRSS